MGASANAVMDSAIENGKIVGAELIVFQHGEQIIRRTAGFFDREANEPMIENAIYRLASVTKPIIAATALARGGRAGAGAPGAAGAAAGAGRE